ncbi:MAG: hypothetical protein J6T10_07345 [Methanobrevibacter sp.]|nr:hypothetical protein [Methanobrevibacter sp.]
MKITLNNIAKVRVSKKYKNTDFWGWFLILKIDEYEIIDDGFKCIELYFKGERIGSLYLEEDMQVKINNEIIYQNDGKSELFVREVFIDGL